MDIFNWRRIDAQVTTSGQPTEDELVQLSKAGVKTIINLGPHWNKGALPDETASVAALGMRYIYIPVDFDDPTREDFETFRGALKEVRDEAVHVHCIYNARVSAFFYVLAKEQGDSAVAQARMDNIWRPGGVWAAFIDNPKAIGSEHLYACEDYDV
jgi:uncharacterized protein (TIGR01244 family)